MITKNDLLKVKLDEEKSSQVMELLGDSAKLLYAEDGYKKAKDEDDLNILTLTKIPKKDNESTSEYIKRATKEWSEANAELGKEELNTQIEELNTKLKAKPGDEKLVQELEDLKAEKAKFPDLLESKTKELQEQLNKERTERSIESRTNQLRKSILAKFKADLDPEYKEYKVNAAIKKAMDTYDSIETNDHGETILTKNSGDYAKVTAKDFFNTEFDSLIDKGVQQQGGGAGAEGGKVKPTELKFEEDETAHSKTSKIREHIATKHGFTPIDDEFDELYNKYSIEAGLKEAPAEK